MKARRTALGVAAAANSATVGRTDAPRTPVEIVGLAHTDPGLTDYLRQRLGFKLGKFADRIVVVRVRFSASAAAGSTKAVQCRVTARLTVGKTVTVGAAAAAARAAFDLAADAHERTVRRRLERRSKLRLRR